MFSRIEILGRLGRDAAIRESQSGRKFIAFTVAVTDKSNGVEETQWFDVLISQNFERYRNMAPHLTKGSMVFLTGDFKCDTEVGNDGVTRCRRNVFCDYVTFAGSGSSNNSDTGATKNVVEKTTAESNAEDEDMPRKTGKKVVKSAPEPEPEDDKDDLPF